MDLKVSLQDGPTCCKGSDIAADTKQGPARNEHPPLRFPARSRLQRGGGLEVVGSRARAPAVI